MKRLLLLATLLLIGKTQAQALNHYVDIKGALRDGQSIHITVDFTQCTPRRHADHQVTGVFSPRSVLIVDDHIATSDHHFTLNNPHFRDQPVIEYIRYTFHENDQLELQVRVLDARDYSPLSEAHRIHCGLGHGVTVSAD